MTPVYLKLESFLSYSKEEIDLEALPSINLITGRNAESSSAEDNNGAGKSSILDAILWNVYGRVRGIFNKDLIKDDIVHLDAEGTPADFARITYIFYLAGTYYKIMREKKFDGPTTLELHSSKDKKLWKNLTLSSGVNKRTGKKENSISRTQQRINDILNASCDLFINSVFFEQQNTNTFATAKASEREALLKDALYLDKWTDYSKLTKEKLREVEKELYAIEYSLKNEGLENLKEKLKEVKESITENLSEIETHEFNYVFEVELEELLREELNDLEKEAIVYKNFQKQLLGVSEELTDLHSRQSSLERTIKSNNDELKEEELNKETYTEEVEKFKVSENETLYELENLTVDETDYTAKNDKIVSDIATFKSQIQQFEEKKTKSASAICPVGQNDCKFISPEAKEEMSKEITANIFHLKKRLDGATKSLQETRAKIAAATAQKERKTQLQKKLASIRSNMATSQLRIDSAVKAVKRLITANSGLVKDLKTIVEQINVKGDEYKELTQKQSKSSVLLEEYQEIKDDLAETIQNREHYKASLSERRDRNAELEVSARFYETKMVDVEVKMKKFNKLADRKQEYDFLVKMFTKDIPHQLIESALPEIEDYAKDFISHLSNGRMDIRFITEREITKKDKETKENLTTDDLYLELEIDGVPKKYALTSGGEKTRADIAIHLAYSCFLLNRSEAKLETIFLDEVASALDRTGVENLMSLLNRLISEFGFKKIFVISQDEKMMKYFDDVLVVKKTANGSKICRMS
jgi:DNA repair exonuclease SbcCD ATPase subunit